MFAHLSANSFKAIHLFREISIPLSLLSPRYFNAERNVAGSPPFDKNESHNAISSLRRHYVAMTAPPRRSQLFHVYPPPFPNDRISLSRRERTSRDRARRDPRAILDSFALSMCLGNKGRSDRIYLPSIGAARLPGSPYLTADETTGTTNPGCAATAASPRGLDKRGLFRKREIGNGCVCVWPACVGMRAFMRNCAKLARTRLGWSNFKLHSSDLLD